MAALIVIVAVAAAYVQALGGGFLWDDLLLIPGMPLVERTAPLGEYLRHPFWMGVSRPGVLTYYRPLVTLSFALDHRIHGDNPAGYHLTNLLFHEANALLLLALLRRFGVRPLVAAVLASAWALLPRLAEAAAWVSGRSDLLATTGVFAALLVWEESLRRRALASLLVFTALLAKEVAIAAVVTIVVVEWLRFADEPRRVRALSTARRLLPAVVAVAGYVALRIRAVGMHANSDPLGGARRAATVLDTIATYSLMLVDVFRPRALIGRLGAVEPWHVAMGAVIVLLPVALILRRHRPLLPVTSVGLALAFAAILPVLHIIPVPLRVVAADRFLYLPTAGLALAVGPKLDAWLGGWRPAWLLAMAVLVTLGVGASRRVGLWSDELEFWIQTYLETPTTNCSAATNLVGVLFRAGQYRDALELSERELSYDDPDKRNARFNIALCLSRLDRKQEAIEQLTSIGSKYHTFDVDVDMQLAVLELQTGRGEAARARLEPLARAGNAAAQQLLVRSSDFARAYAALAAIPSSEMLARARLLAMLGEEASAIPAWLAVADDLNVSKATLHEALLYLVRTGDRAAIAGIARRYVTRFGALDPEVDSMVAVRLDEIDRVRAARTRLGLHGS